MTEPARTPSEIFNQKRRDARSTMDSKIRMIDEDEQDFNKLIARYKEYPILSVPNNVIESFKNNYRIDVRAIFSEIAKANNWLDIIVHESMPNEIHVVVPNKHGTQKLVSGLLVVAEPYLDATWKSNLTVEVRPRSWQFKFKGSAGEALFDAWVAQCKEDKHYQIVLGFGPMYNRREK